MKKEISILLTVLLFFCQSKAKANLKTATPANYTSFISGLVPGDTLYLTAGSYTNQFNLSNLNGTSVMPIVIMGAGNTTVFLGNACCNTVNVLFQDRTITRKILIQE